MFTISQVSVKKIWVYSDRWDEVIKSAPKNAAESITKNFPELDKLSISPDEKYARAKALARMTEIVRDPAKHLGSKEKFLNEPSFNTAVKHISDLVWQLKYTKDLSSFLNEVHNKTFLGWDADGTANLSLATFSGTKMSNRIFLQKVLNDSQLANRIIEPTPPVENMKDLERVNRVRRFLAALEKQDPDFNRAILRKADTLLRNGKLDEASEYLEKPLKDEKNIEIGKILTPNWLSEALRAIGDKGWAAENMADQTKKTITEASEGDTDLKKLGKYIEEQTSAPWFMEKKQKQAEWQFAAMLAAYPEADPDRIELVQNRSQIIEGLKNNTAFMDCMTTYIKNNGSKWLGTAAKAYDDMKGLYGWSNWSDENVTMAKEVAIMLASTILTMGASAYLAGGAALLRIGQWAKTLAAATRYTGALARTRTAVSFGTNTLKAKSYLWAARVVEWAIWVDNGFKRGKIVYEAAKFTTFDAALRSGFFREEGARSGFDGFENFAKKLAMNTAMFWAFGGMEKLLGKALPAKFAHAKWLTFEHAGKLVALSAGDIGVMQALHAAETGKIEWDTTSAIQALVFRAGLSATMSSFPKLNEKYNRLLERWQLVWEWQFAKSASLGVAPKNGKMIDKGNFSGVEKDLGITLTDIQKKAITEAHTTGDSGIGNFTSAELKAKNKILKDAGFTPKEIRTLMEKGYVGKEKWSHQTPQHQINKVTGVSKKWKLKESDILTDNELGLMEWDAQVRTADQQVANEMNAIKTISKNKNGISNESMKSDRIIEAQSVKNQNIVALERDAKLIEIRQKVMEKYISNNGGKALGSNDTIHFQIGSRAFVVGKNGEKYRIIEENNFQKNGVVEYELGYSNTNEVIDHLSKIAKTEYNGKLKELWVKNPEIFFGDKSLTTVNEIINPKKYRNTEATPETQATIDKNTEAIKNYPLVVVKEKALIPLDSPKNPQEKLIKQAEQNALATRLEKGVIDASFREITGENLPKNPRDWGDSMKKHWWKLLLVWGLIGTILLLQKSTHDAQDPEHPVPPPTEADTQTPEAAAAYCEKCSTKARSTLDYTRANGSLTLDEKRRESISRKWSRTKEWAEVAKIWNESRNSLPQDAQEAMYKVLNTPSAENVQNLQHCIGMTYTDDTGVELDDAHGQDGILGPITTQARRDYISSCSSGSASADKQQTESTDTESSAVSAEESAENPLEA